MRVLAIVQARLDSTRLPRKVLAEIRPGVMVLDGVLQRADSLPYSTRLCVTCPVEDRPILERVCRGNEWLMWSTHEPPDVLTGFAKLIRLLGADYMYRVTGDCPLLDPALGSLLWAEIDRGADYAWIDTAGQGWPDGVDLELMRADLLLQADQHATDPADREHVTTWIRRQPQIAVAAPACPPELASRVKLSVDTQEDLARVRAVYAQLPGPYPPTDLLSTLAAARQAGVVVS